MELAIGWELILTSNSVAFSQAWVPAELGWPSISPATVPPSQLLLLEEWTKKQGPWKEAAVADSPIFLGGGVVPASSACCQFYGGGVGFNLSTMLSAYFTYRHEKIFLLYKPFSIITTVF